MWVKSRNMELFRLERNFKVEPQHVQGHIHRDFGSLLDSPFQEEFSQNIRLNLSWCHLRPLAFVLSLIPFGRKS